MAYTPHDFKRDLERELSKGYDVVRVARSVFCAYQQHCREVSPDLYKKMFQIIALEEGPEFELSEEQLWQFARSLTEDDSERGSDLEE